MPPCPLFLTCKLFGKAFSKLCHHRSIHCVPATTNPGFFLDFIFLENSCLLCWHGTFAPLLFSGSTTWANSWRHRNGAACGKNWASAGGAKWLPNLSNFQSQERFPEGEEPKAMEPPPQDHCVAWGQQGGYSPTSTLASVCCHFSWSTAVLLLRFLAGNGNFHHWRRSCEQHARHLRQHLGVLFGFGTKLSQLWLRVLATRQKHVRRMSVPTAAGLVLHSPKETDACCNECTRQRLCEALAKTNGCQQRPKSPWHCVSDCKPRRNTAHTACQLKPHRKLWAAAH